jgi:arylsulfatase
MMNPSSAALRRILRAALILALAARAFAASAPRPNVLLILADDLGFSDLGCYGSEIATPHLDALAGGGLRFTQFYNTARCWPTRAAILTGYYPQQVRRDPVFGTVNGKPGQRPAWAVLLPELLRPAGYRSYHSGKWHVDGEPRATGFDRSFDVTGSQNNYFKSANLVADGVPLAPNPGFYLTTAIADHAIASLREHTEHFRDRPFFHYLAFTAPHFPLHAPAADIARVGNRYRVGWDTVRHERFARMQKLGFALSPLAEVERDLGPPYGDARQALARLGPGEVNRPLPWDTLTAEQREFQAAKMAIHAAMIEVMDREIGRVLAQIRAMGAWEDTLVLFLSDNGATAEIMVRGGGHDPSAALGSEPTYLTLGPGWSSAANTPFRRHKTWVHEGGIATPLIAHWPRGIPARGELNRDVGHAIDFVPTLLELAGVAAVPAAPGQPVRPGRSLVPAFVRRGAATREFLYFDHDGNRAIRAGDWKLVSARHENNAWELYDLSRDRGESHDLGAAHPERVRALAALWQRTADEFRATASGETKPASMLPSANP